MAERRKKIKFFGKDNYNENNLLEKIKKLSEGLYYLSETDAEICVFAGGTVTEITTDVLLNETENLPNKKTTEIDFTNFFDKLCQKLDWYNEQDNKKAERFCKLKELLESNLTQLKVYKIGKIQIEIYVIGLDKRNRITGIKTKAVET